MEPRATATHLVDHLFRHEAGRMVAALCRVLGVHNLDLAEEIVQETLCQALELWRFDRIPDNPAAWLMRVAKNRAIDAIRKQRNARRFAPELAATLQPESSLATHVDAVFTDHEIADEQLRMMFACCHAQISPESQIMLILKILCGFGVHEIAQAFLTGEAAIEKRLARARQVLAESGLAEDVAGESPIRRRLGAVHQALYLLFSEGYHGSHPSLAIREDLCAEAMRLAILLAEHPAGDVPASHALLALMCFHAARLPARMDEHGLLVELAGQDRTRWIRPLIEQGLRELGRSSQGGELTPYHLEAGIAAAHCSAAGIEDTDWPAILGLYDLLLEIRPTPIVALNRAIVVAQIHGPDAGLANLDLLASEARLESYQFLAAAQGELHRRAGRLAEARRHLDRAIALARNEAERRFLEAKRAALGA
jgi:RNA polymerase sigma factor (sigma-70 family)